MDVSSIQTLNRIGIFGYGSLTWNPNFVCKSKKIGYIRGYVRRFWQGNTTHRGTPEKPGRVATLVENIEGTVWGVSYEVEGNKNVKEVLELLSYRETELGGYTTVMTHSYPRANSDGETDQPIDVVFYTANDENSLYMGPCDIDKMAEQIVNAHGFSRSNSEYVTKLTDYVQQNIPEDDDEHLFELDRCVRKHLQL